MTPIRPPADGKPLKPGLRPSQNRPPYYDRPDWDDHYDYWYDDHWYWPVGAVAAGVAAGTILSALPPSCRETSVEGNTYFECDGTWYQPYYEGGILKYRVVEDPTR